MADMLKVVIIGDGGVGKTSLRNQYIHHRFQSSYKATIGADFVSKTLTINNHSIALQIWDTAGQERFKSLTSVYYRGSDCCIIVFDVSNPISLENTTFWACQFFTQSNMKTLDFSRFVLVGNKLDVERRISRRQIHEKIAEIKTKLNELSIQHHLPTVNPRKMDGDTRDQAYSELRRDGSLKSKEALKQEYVHSTNFSDSMYSVTTTTSEISEMLDDLYTGYIKYFEVSSKDGTGVEEVFEYIAGNVTMAPRAFTAEAFMLPGVQKKRDRCAC